MPGPDLAGRTALRPSSLEFLDRLAKIFPPPRIPRHLSNKPSNPQRGGAT